jgi:hypothetical protein
VSICGSKETTDEENLQMLGMQSSVGKNDFLPKLYIKEVSAFIT